MDQKMIPFGKYQGQPVEALQADPQYVEWLMTQDWFRSKHKTIYNIVINKFGEPEETPEHNRIQAMFLSKEFRKKFTCAAIRKRGYHSEANLQKSIHDFATEWPVIKSNASQGWAASKIKDDCEWKFELLKRFCQEKSIVLSEEVEFEKNAVDCSFFASVPFGSVRFRIEIKPNIGDDYPAILRQMRNNGSEYLLYENFSASGVDLNTMTSFFESQKIFIFSLFEISKSEIFNFPESLPDFA